jgi:alkylated DNA repair dioxygenase AlkB
MRIGSHDFMTTSANETQADDTVAIVTDDREGAVSNGFKYTRVISEHDIGRSIDTNFNTILLNKYKNGGDCIGFHRDRETGWVEGTGFATLCFGAERDFQIKDEETGKVRNIPHQDGWVIHMPHPMNQNYLHGVPKRKRVTDCRISLTFREIVANQL